jgi:hypothetical protein
MEELEGFVPLSQLAIENLEKPGLAFAEGEDLPLKVIRADPQNRRIVLSARAYFSSRENEELEAFRASHPIREEAPTEAEEKRGSAAEDELDVDEDMSLEAEESVESPPAKAEAEGDAEEPEGSAVEEPAVTDEETPAPVTADETPEEPRAAGEETTPEGPEAATDEDREEEERKHEGESS